MVEFGSSDLTVEDLREMYRLMLMGRRFTERTLELYEEGRLKPYHPSAGALNSPHATWDTNRPNCIKTRPNPDPPGPPPIDADGDFELG